MPEQPKVIEIPNPPPPPWEEPKEPKSKIVAYDDIPVGGGSKPAEVIEVNYDWGEPPPRIKKRFGKSKKKGEKEKEPEKKKENASKAAKRAEKQKLLEKRKKYDPRAALKKAKSPEEAWESDHDNSVWLEEEEKSVKLISGND